MSTLIVKLEGIERRHAEIMQRLSDPAVLADQSEYQRVAKLHAEVNPVVEEFHRLRKLLHQMAGARGLLEETVEPEMREMAAAELEDLQKQREALEASLEVMLLPKDPADDRNIILEIRAGAGGEEAGLFAAALLRMYTLYAETQRWREEMIAGNVTFSRVAWASSKTSGGIGSRTKPEARLSTIERCQAQPVGSKAATAST